MIRLEEARLKATFQRLLLLSLGIPGGVYACSSSSGFTNPPETDAGVDATFPDVAISPPPADAGTDALDAAVVEAACYAAPHSAPYYSDASWVTIPDAGPDAAASLCFYFIDYPQGIDCQYQGCNFYLTTCAQVCNAPDDGGNAFFDCQYWSNCQGSGVDASYSGQPGTPTTIACGLCSGVGRRPAGLAKAASPKSKTALGEWFARAAHLEAASVDAFAALEAELVLHGAPRSLARTARRSARDEVRHARVTGAIARRFGGEPAKVRVKRRAPRSLEAVARENAVEGCVRETFGAMVATWQASHANDVEIAGAMKRIAADETRHAALAWAIARWADGKLDAAARARVARARQRAVEKLVSEIARTNEEAIADVAGLPSRAVAQRWVEEMRRSVWS